MALNTVQDYLTETRVVLQDLIEPYRYTDTELVSALNMAFMEARRLRPDSVAASLDAVPEYSTANLAATVAMDQQLRPALVYYMAGRAHLRDDEITDDSRAAGLLNKFTAQMITIQS